MKPFDLCVLGSVNVDYVLRVPHFPRAGETLMGEDYRLVYGGKGANQAVAAARLGARVAFIATVGEDAIGAEMKSAFAAEGIDVRAVMAVPGQTGMAMIQVAQGENSIVVVPGANAALSPERLAPHRPLLEQASHLLMQLESPLNTLMQAAQWARAAGVKVILNPAPAQALPEALLSLLDGITPNETEAETLTGVAVTDEASAARAAQRFHDWGIPWVWITRGSQGVYASENGRGQNHPAFTVQAVDSTAAGDTFNAALLCARLRSQEQTEALRFAQAAAALSVSRLGAQSSIPRRQEVEDFLKQQP